MSLSEQQNNRRDNNTNPRPRNVNHFRNSNNNRQWIPRGAAPAPVPAPTMPVSGPSAITTSTRPVASHNTGTNGNEAVNRNVRPVASHNTGTNGNEAVNRNVRPVASHNTGTNGNEAVNRNLRPLASHNTGTNGNETVNRNVRPVQNRNGSNFGSRGNPNRYRDDRGRGKPFREGGNNRVVNPDSSVPQLVQEIQEKLSKGTVECMICYDMVRRSAPIWSCSSCYSIFHLNCIKKWARAPTSIDLMAEKNQGFNWRCPGCQSVQLMSTKEIRYVCFCGKRSDPPSDLYLTPHSCGEACGKRLEREVPGSGVSAEDICPHACVLQCHPGPCPPCKAFAPPRNCPCGKKVITTRCSDRKSVLTCGQKCDKLLECGRHQCGKACHVGPCDPCQVTVNAPCFCKKRVEVVLCGDMAVKGEVSVEDGVFSCSSICDQILNCGNHACHEICHPGPCGECELLPHKVTTCCCGKTSLMEVRNSCLDPIPTCTETCGKILPCRLHNCQDVCHAGACSPCQVRVTQNCRCGSTSRTVECYKTLEEKEQYTCNKPCGRKKSCGRHRCSEKCCPLSNPKNSASNDWDPHLCSMPCEKKLRCGQHDCVSLCHSGHCPPCLETIFTDLSCACGATSIPPPLPCGTPPPSCQLPCSVSQPCGHPSSHSCHFGDCPPCSVPILKECVGGHVVLRNIPCGSKDIRCNKLCGKPRQCGLHACSRTCHPSPCDTSSGSVSGLRTSCGQTCGAPRRDCRHTCTSLCHPSAPCPDVRCEFPVTITCSCGRLSATVPCDAGGSDGGNSASVLQHLPAPLQPCEGTSQRIPLGQRKFMCDDDCAKVERKKVLADAFGVVTPNLDALHFGDTAAVSEVLSDLLRRDAKWVLSVEERCKYLVLGKSRGGMNSLKVHVFCPMSKDKRDAVRLIADRWKLSIHSAGWEPKRFVVVHVTPKSKTPARVLGLKSANPGHMLQPSPYDPLVDMDPRLVVALFDLPREADVSALVLRFGGECELVWLNDKNALSVFSDPARAATAMRRLDQGSVYHGASVLHQNGTASSGSSPWSKDVVTPSASKANPWKKAVLQESDWKESSWGSSEEWSPNAVNAETTVRKEKEGSSSNRWTVLEPGSPSRIANEPKKVEFEQQGQKASAFSSKPSDDSSADVVDDWEKAYD